MKELSYNQARKIHKLIRAECCNCIDGKCLLLDDDCMQLGSIYHICCNYFRRAVLPLDESLCAELTAKDNAKRCEKCKKYFVPNSNRQKYCSECSEQNRSEYMKKYMRERRSEC